MGEASWSIAIPSSALWDIPQGEEWELVPCRASETSEDHQADDDQPRQEPQKPVLPRIPKPPGRLTTEQQEEYEKKSAEQKKILKEGILNYCRWHSQGSLVQATPAVTRTVIFVGKTRSGKSTSIKLLSDPFYLPPEPSLFAQTKEPQVHAVTVEVPTVCAPEADRPGNHTTDSSFLARERAETIDRVSYNINIIDTPGLFELRLDEAARDEEEIEHLILQCLKQEVTKVNAVYFVIGYHGSLHLQDVAALDRFLELFKLADGFLKILITNCERLTDEEREHVKEELLNAPQFKKILQRMSTTPAVNFMGAVPIHLFDAGHSDAFFDLMERVQEMRHELFLSIFESRDYFELQILKSVQDLREAAQEILDRCIMGIQHPSLEADLMSLLKKFPFLPNSLKESISQFCDSLSFEQLPKSIAKLIVNSNIPRSPLPSSSSSSSSSSAFSSASPAPTPTAESQEPVDLSIPAPLLPTVVPSCTEL